MTTPKQTLEQFLRDNAAFIDSNGIVISPEAGGNYLASGQSAVDYYNRNIGQQYAGSGWDGNATDNPLPYQDSLSLAWQPGREDRGGWLAENLAKWEEPAKFAAVAAAMAAGVNGLAALSAGADSAALAAFDASQSGGLLGGSVTGTALAPLGAEGIGGYSFGSGIGGDLLASTPGFESALSGGALGSAGIESSLVPAASGGGWLESLNGASKFMKENAGLTQLAGALGGALASKDTTTSASQSKDPWAPAQPYLKDNLATNANMQEYYRANPFSTEQKTAYQGLLNTLANNQMNAQGLLANASNFGKSSGGKMPAMTGLLSGTQAPIIDWSQYTNLGRK